MRISDWSSDVCSSDLAARAHATDAGLHRQRVDADATRFEHEVRAALAHLEAGEVTRGVEHHEHGTRHAFPRALQVELGQCREEIGRASCRESVCQYV